MLEDSLRINAIGPLLLVQAVAHLLADGATVANISTQMASLATRNEFRSPSYSMSKAAQNMATVQLAHALKPRGIKVVALSPGWVPHRHGRRRRRNRAGGIGGRVAGDDRRVEGRRQRPFPRLARTADGLVSGRGRPRTLAAQRDILFESTR